MDITISAAPVNSALGDGALLFSFEHEGLSYSGNTYETAGAWHVYAVQHAPDDADAFSPVGALYGVIENTEEALRAHLIAGIAALSSSAEWSAPDFDLGGDIA